jgi:hypothetical protein
MLNFKQRVAAGLVVGAFTLAGLAGFVDVNRVEAGYQNVYYGSGCTLTGGSFKSPDAENYSLGTQPWCSETYLTFSWVWNGNPYTLSPGWDSGDQGYTFSQVTSAVFSTHGAAVAGLGRSDYFFGTNDY